MEHSRYRDASIRSKMETTTLSRRFNCLDVNRSALKDDFRSQPDMAGRRRLQPKIEDPGLRSGDPKEHAAISLKLKKLPRSRNTMLRRRTPKAGPGTAKHRAVRRIHPGSLSPVAGPRPQAHGRDPDGNPSWFRNRRTRHRSGGSRGASREADRLGRLGPATPSRPARIGREIPPAEPGASRAFPARGGSPAATRTGCRRAA